ncbi:MAG: hypothetical protein V2A65_10970 [Candidatus Omnitrophota bacterium]
MPNMPPLQIIHSFEGLINATDGIEVMISFGRPKEPPDVSNFEPRVREELSKLKERGIGGLAVNVGYANYLENEDAWERFLVGFRAACEMGFRLWIYDENGYPSGTAGGNVLRDHPELEAIGLKKMEIKKPVFPLTISLPEPRASFYAAFGVGPDKRRRQLKIEKGSRKITVETGRYKTVEIYFLAPLYEGAHCARNAGSSRRYINLLDSRAVNRFLKVTHAKYFEKIPADLRRNLEAVFTDEPSLMAHVMPFPHITLEEDPVDSNLPILPSVPWCGEIEARFLAENASALESRVWMLFRGTNREERRVRRAFWSIVAGLYRNSFSEQAANVCAAMGFDLSGHFLHEETIYQHAVFSGNLLEALKYFQRPGIDVLSCNPALFFRTYILTHRVALSASFFGSQKGLMTETSDYSEYWHGDRKGASVEEIKYVLVMQYLMGVRDFCFYFVWRRFSPEEYRAICDFTAFLVETGTGGSFRPSVGLYYPIEMIWDWYLPSNMPMMKEGFESQPEHLKRVQEKTTEACNALFLANKQFVFCGREEIGRLKEMGIDKLIYPDVGRPEAELIRLCRETGVKLVPIKREVELRPGERFLKSGRSVVYSCFGKFIFAVNYGKEKSFVSVNREAEVNFPSRERTRRRVSGRIDLEPYESIFIFKKEDV